ncbi:MAG: S8 family serine peptidase [Bacteroidota bacterium]
MRKIIRGILPYLMLVSSMLMASDISAQTSDYWVFFSDKEGVDFIPENFFSEKAMQRRNLQGIDFTENDKPVSEHYLQQLTPLVDELTGNTRWFNAAWVKGGAEQMEAVRALPFVKSVQPARVWQQSACASTGSEYLADLDLMHRQVNMFFPEILKEKSLNGKGVRIAVLDAGFPAVNTHNAFEHLRSNKQIIAMHDFVKDKETVWHGNAHGTMVLSCIAGKREGEIMGLAQAAEFLLARTEKNFEPYREEIHWLEAMEWADKKGADIINSSLGYTYHRYFQPEMDGKTSLVSKAANMAAKKGMLVVNAAGNEGDGGWRVVGTPADADSILTVGGVDPDDNLHISFSSYGPTADGRLKPNVVASGKALVANEKGYTTAYGTSFASPLTCGFAACVKQAFPELSVMELIEKIESAGSLYPYYDYAHGYGIPNAWKLFADMPEQKDPPFMVIEEDEQVSVMIPASELASGGLHTGSYLFYHIADPDGSILEYKVVRVYKTKPVSIPKSRLEGRVLRVHFESYTHEKKY